MRWLALWEIVSIVSSTLIIAWVVEPFANSSKIILAVPLTLSLGLIVFSHFVRGETLHDLGWRVDNFLPAVRLLLLPMLLASVLFLLIGWLWGSWQFHVAHGWRSSLLMPIGGIAWGLLQQYVLQGFVNRRAQMLFGPGTVSILLVALIFALLHLPNPGLMLATFFGGLVWATVYQRTPNLFALALSHALMTWVMTSTVPASALHNLRVGYKYFT